MVSRRLARAGGVLRRWWREHRGRALAGAAALVLVLAALALTVLRPGDEPADDDPEYAEVETLIVDPIDFEDWIETTGAVEARADAVLTAEVGGTVIAVAEEGSAVQAGEVVARLDAGQAEAAVVQARAAVSEARANVQQTEQAFARQAPLVDDTIISPLEFDQVRAQRSQARAQLAQTLAAQREAEEVLERTRLRSPFAGVVEQRWVRSGEQVAAGQEVIRVVGPGLMEIAAGLPERFAGDIVEGTPAVIDFNAYGLGTVRRRVDFVGNAVDPQSRTFPIRIDLTDADARIKGEMIARVRVVRRVVPGALVVPREAILRDEREQSIMVLEPLDSLGFVRRRTIRAGASSEQGVVIEAGLRAGEQVVILGQTEVVGQDTVRVVRRFRGLEAYRAEIAPEPAGGGV